MLITAFQEFPHDFGVVSANVVAQYSLPDGVSPTTFRGSGNVLSSAKILYAIVRNQSKGFVVVNKGQFASRIEIGQTKRIEFPAGARFFTVTPSATTVAGELTADVGIEGVIL